MAAGVCFQREYKQWMQDQWSWVFTNFAIKRLWERAKDSTGDLNIYQPTVAIDSAAELPDDPLVVLAPIDGRFIAGERSLVMFEHPDDAIYLFGPSYGNLWPDTLGGRDPDHLVYIPTAKLEMYSYAAAYVTFYDRLAKRGEFG